MQVAIQQIVVSPGQQLLLKNVSWQQYQEILASLGESRNSRIAYSQGMLEIMVPLPEHEDDKVIIGDLVKAILEEIDIEFRSLGSTTFENEQMLAAVEPDDCFYIQNEAAIRGKKRLNLKVDPPPDLAIEIDITSKTKLAIYQNLKVPELWRYNGQKLEINILQSGKYVQSNQSLIFPNLPIIEAIPEHLERSKVIGRNATMKLFRAWLKTQLNIID
ncbi:Uma2 family endonuclease [Phormidium sp. LEGE 05292]|uniref:Uma2 family endonuclease n=1 Tax=[Phormidium] sp. LEGE 05292 TaxID=767427 RepID=UPI001882E5D6|nr:Uma2 family endonuclease [Phormidium sp. LEGE 05292]MBE9229440.1 Uma2 family endonuclease [Phormidium sp. LEGE 05292]